MRSFAMLTRLPRRMERMTSISSDIIWVCADSDSGGGSFFSCSICAALSFLAFGFAGLLGVVDAGLVSHRGAKTYGFVFAFHERENRVLAALIAERFGGPDFRFEFGVFHEQFFERFGVDIACGAGGRSGITVADALADTDVQTCGEFDSRPATFCFRVAIFGGLRVAVSPSFAVAMRFLLPVCTEGTTRFATGDGQRKRGQAPPDRRDVEFCGAGWSEPVPFFGLGKRCRAPVLDLGSGVTREHRSGSEN